MTIDLATFDDFDKGITRLLRELAALPDVGLEAASAVLAEVLRSAPAADDPAAQLRRQHLIKLLGSERVRVINAE